MNRKTIPLLITMDLELAPDHDYEQQTSILSRLLADFGSVPSTIFCTGTAAVGFTDHLREWTLAGSEIGCHGLTHGEEEDFRYLNEADVRRIIREASDQLETAVGDRPRVFRGPRMRTSSTTQKILEALGYQVDASVCPRRVDRPRAWLNAPRQPYHPSHENPYRRGNRQLLVLPLSAFGLPLISGVLYLFGMTVAKTLFRLLLAEAHHEPQPALVYLFHSYEFTSRLHAAPDNRPFQQRLYISNPERRYAMHRELVEYMLSFPEVKPVTAMQLCTSHQIGKNHEEIFI